MLTGVERTEPTPTKPEGPTPAEAKKAAKKLTKEAEEAIEAAVEAQAQANDARKAADDTLRELRRARDAADDFAVVGLDIETLMEFWRLRDSEHGKLELLGRGLDGTVVPRERHLMDVLRLGSIPVKAVAPVADRLGSGANDGPLAEHRERQRRYSARSMIAGEMIFAVSKGETPSARELAERALARAFPGRPQGSTSRRWI